jgi:hypothetical protein
VSVPPEVMQRMMGAGGAKPPGAPAAPGGPTPGVGPGAGAVGAGGAKPGASPTPQGQDKKGLKAAAMSNIHIAQNMMEQALTAFEPHDPEYKMILKCLTSMAPHAGKNDSSDLVPAEVMKMVGQLPQMGGGTDVQKMILQQMKQGQQHGQPPQGQPQPPQPQGAPQ